MKKRYWAEASFTIESAFVVPLVLGMILAFLYFLFVLHDQVVLSGRLQTNMVAIAESDDTESVSEIAWKKSLQQNVWMLKMKQSQVSCEPLCWNGSVDEKMVVQVPLIYRVSLHSMKFHIQENILRMHPEVRLRVKRLEQ